MRKFVLAIDCGTHAVRSILFDIATSEAMLCAEEELPLIHRSPDAVEIDPWMVADRSVAVLRSAAERAQLDGRIIAMGITNMRETAFAWDRATLEPACDGVMWMSQQSHEIVERWRAEGLDPLLRERTGLQNRTFFFPSKVAGCWRTSLASANSMSAGSLRSEPWTLGCSPCSPLDVRARRMSPTAHAPWS